MLEPMADPSINKKKKKTNLNNWFVIELAHELDEKIADIRKLAYDVSTKLKSIILIKDYLLHILVL